MNGSISKAALQKVYGGASHVSLSCMGKVSRQYRILPVVCFYTHANGRNFMAAASSHLIMRVRHELPATPAWDGGAARCQLFC